MRYKELVTVAGAHDFDQILDSEFVRRKELKSKSVEANKRPPFGKRNRIFGTLLTI